MTVLEFEAYIRQHFPELHYYDNSVPSRNHMSLAFFIYTDESTGHSIHVSADPHTPANLALSLIGTPFRGHDVDEFLFQIPEETLYPVTQLLHNLKNAKEIPWSEPSSHLSSA